MQTVAIGHTFQIEEGPATGQEVAMPSGVGFYYVRTADGRWHAYALRPDDDGVTLRYLGPIIRR